MGWVEGVGFPLYGFYAPIAQLVEHPAFNRMAAGSNPAGRTFWRWQKMKTVILEGDELRGEISYADYMRMVIGRDPRLRKAIVAFPGVKPAIVNNFHRGYTRS